MDISIIIVNWNTKKMLVECIESIQRNQLDVSQEIIVVDNASEDGSADEVRKRFATVKVVENETNLGFSKANNIGISQALGRYVCLCNSDIEVLGDAVGQLVRYLDQHPEAGAVGPKTLNADRSLRKNCRRFPNLWNTFCAACFFPRFFPGSRALNGTLMTEFDHESVRKVDVLPGCFFAVRRSVIDEAGPLDERYFIYGEDKDWCHRIADAGYRVDYYPYAEVVHYTKGSSSKAPVRFMVEKIKANYQYWKRFHSGIERFFFLQIMRYHYGLRLFLIRFSMLFGSRKDEGKSSQLLAFRACLYWLSHRDADPIEIGMRFSAT